MQFAKDSFYMALRTRLAALNPQRVVNVAGVTRPAVLVAENELATAAPLCANTFYLQWGAARVADKWAGAASPLMAIECAIAYRTTGSADSGQDRGRTLAALDDELRQICLPANTPKCDFTQTPALQLGTMVMWDTPQFGAVTTTSAELRRETRITVYSFPGSNTGAGVATPLTRQARVYLAPVNRATETPASFDPASLAAFPLDAPPSPWINTGWIENLKRTPGTKIEAVRGGARGMVAAQFRSNGDARVEFDFLEWGKLQMALAGGSQHLNLLQPAQTGVLGTAGNAVPLQAGSTASQLVIGAVAAAQFSPGDLVAVDIDYAVTQGYIGSGISGAYVANTSTISDPDYVRRVTFNVGRVASVAGAVLNLSQALIGGIPSANAKVQKLTGLADREGGSFFQEWSALIVLPDEAGARVCFYYPRLQPCAPAQEMTMAVQAPLHAVGLHASFVALPVSDAIDGESVLCWRVYVPG